jgi:hypothetical protein
MHPNNLLPSATIDGSDHCPLLFSLNSIKPGKPRFHFEAFWSKHGLLFVLLVALLTPWKKNSEPQLRAFKVGATRKLGISILNSGWLERSFTSWKLSRMGELKFFLGFQIKKSKGRDIHMSNQVHKGYA